MVRRISLELTTPLIGLITFHADNLSARALVKVLQVLSVLNAHNIYRRTVDNDPERARLGRSLEDLMLFGSGAAHPEGRWDNGVMKLNFQSRGGLVHTPYEYEHFTLPLRGSAEKPCFLSDCSKRPQQPSSANRPRRRPTGDPQVGHVNVYQLEQGYAITS